MSRRVAQALKAAGAILLRRNKHYVYRLPNGAQVVISGTPASDNSERWILSEIRRKLSS